MSGKNVSSLKVISGCETDRKPDNCPFVGIHSACNTFSVDWDFRGKPTGMKDSYIVFFQCLLYQKILKKNGCRRMSNRLFCEDWKTNNKLSLFSLIIKNKIKEKFDHRVLPSSLNGP